MAHWIKCTTKTSAPIYVNIDDAMTMFWNDGEKATYIAFAGGTDDDSIAVRERPEEILKRITS